MKMITGSPTAWLGGQRVTLSARAHGSIEIADVELHPGITPKSASGSLDGEDWDLKLNPCHDEVRPGDQGRDQRYFAHLRDVNTCGLGCEMEQINRKEVYQSLSFKRGTPCAFSLNLS